MKLGVELAQEVGVHPSGLLDEIPGTRVDQVGAWQPTVCPWISAWKTRSRRYAALSHDLVVLQLPLVLAVDLVDRLPQECWRHLRGHPLDLLEDQVGIHEPMDSLQLDVDAVNPTAEVWLGDPNGKFPDAA